MCKMSKLQSSQENDGFLPFQFFNNINNTERHSIAQSYSGETQSLGVDVTCTHVNSTHTNGTLVQGLPNNITAHLDITGSKAALNPEEAGATTLRVHGSDGVPFNCSNQHEVEDVNTYTELSRSGLFAAEVFRPLGAEHSNATQAQKDLCTGTLLVSFLRLNRTVLLAGTAHENVLLSDFTSLHLACQPSLRTARTSATVDPDGRVLNSSTPSAGSYITDLIPFFTNSANETACYSEITDKMAAGRTFSAASRALLHTDTFAIDRFTYLIKATTNSSDFLNGSLPLPAAGTMIPHVEPYLNVSSPSS